MRKALLGFIFTLLFLIFGGTPIHAQITNPELKLIDSATETVTVSFPDLDTSGGSNYKMCLRSDLCIANPIYQQMAPDKLEKFFVQGFDDDDIDSDDDYFKDLPDGNTVTVCGDGESALKTDCDNPQNDYFHAGRFYLVTIFEEQGEKWLVRTRAGFYINRHHPIVKVAAKNNKPPENFDVSITLDALDKKGKKNDNNFQVIFEGPGIKEEVCVPKSDPKIGEAFPTITFPTDKWKDDKDNKGNGNRPEGVVSGKYTIKINEQKSEGGLDGNSCEGGFTYSHHVCIVDAKKGTKCNEVKDPNQSDAAALFELFDLLAQRGNGALLPCKQNAGEKIKNPLDCEAIDTAIGTIELNPVDFITRVFSIVLSVAGLGAVILIIFSGYKILASRGNPEIIKGARETLTAAIVGLIFIIFSFVILSVITETILKIPGFTQ